MDTSVPLSTLVMGAGSVLISLVVAVVGYLVKRAIDANDKEQAELKTAVVVGMEKLAGKVDGLAAQDGQHAVSIVELKVRLAHVESEVLQIQRRTQRQRSTDSGGT